MNMVAQTTERIVWIAVNERGETAVSTESREKAANRLAWNSLAVEVHRCRAVLPVPVVATIEMTTERVES